MVADVEYLYIRGINEAGDVAGQVKFVNEIDRHVFGLALEGTWLNMPVYRDTRQEGTYVGLIEAINDATEDHGVQVLGQIGSYSKRWGGISGYPWDLWEADGKITISDEVTEFPTGQILRPLNTNRPLSC